MFCTLQHPLICVTIISIFRRFDTSRPVSDVCVVLLLSFIVPANLNLLAGVDYDYDNDDDDDDDDDDEDDDDEDG